MWRYTGVAYRPYWEIIIFSARKRTEFNKSCNLIGSGPERKGSNNMSIRLARDQVVLLETAANLWASQSKANDFFADFSTFELGGITKHSMTGPTGNSAFVSPRPQCFIEGLGGETKLAVCLHGTNHLVLIHLWEKQNGFPFRFGYPGTKLVLINEVQLIQLVWYILK